MSGIRYVEIGIELSVPKRKLFFIEWKYENAYFYVPRKSLFQFFFPFYWLICYTRITNTSNIDSSFVTKNL